MFMLRPALLAALLGTIAPTSAFAAEGPPAHQSELEVFGADPCPQSTSDEIVVCRRRPEEERYRIPAPLRHGRNPPAQAWTARVETLDEIARSTMPGSCSPVGSFGQSGCAQAQIRQWYADRRAAHIGGY